MFGQSFLPAPIIEQDITEWIVYLPKSNTYYDKQPGNYAGVINKHVFNIVSVTNGRIRINISIKTKTVTYTGEKVSVTKDDLF
jgi:hypothetical protein